MQGYIEGEYVLIGPETGGRLTNLAVKRGDHVAADAVLFEQDDRDERSALVEAEAKRAAGAATLADLKSGRRPEEIRVLDAQLAEAEATLTAAQKAYDRYQALSSKAVASVASLDQSTADLDVAKARVGAARENRAVAELAARPDAIDAATQNLAALDAAVQAAQTALARRSRSAPTAGRIENTFYRVGEMVPAGQAVISLLPESGARKVVFFVPETSRSRVAPGTRIAIGCDGCASGLAATVSNVATDAEFAPPVIYSKESRAKLVFRVEALPEGAALQLDPGQPLDITLASGS